MGLHLSERTGGSGNICGGFQQRVEGTRVCEHHMVSRVSVVTCSRRCHDHTTIGASRFHSDVRCVQTGARIVHGRARSRSTSRRSIHLNHVRFFIQILATCLCRCLFDGGGGLRMGGSSIVEHKHLDEKSFRGGSNSRPPRKLILDVARSISKRSKRRPGDGHRTNFMDGRKNADMDPRHLLFVYK